MCSLPRDFNYEVVLFSAGHNFKGFAPENYPYEECSIFFHNLTGVKSEEEFEKMKVNKKGTEGIEFWNLATFLSRFDAGVFYSYDDSLHEDYIAFRLRISKDVFEKEQDLQCLPMGAEAGEGCQLMAVYGHPGIDGSVEKLPLMLSSGTRTEGKEILPQLEAWLEDGGRTSNPSFKKNTSIVNSNKKLFHSCDTLHGSSGSPVVTVVKEKTGGKESTTTVVVGIHNGGMDTLVEYREGRKNRPKINYAHDLKQLLTRFDNWENGGHLKGFLKKKPESQGKLDIILRNYL